MREESIKFYLYEMTSGTASAVDVCRNIVSKSHDQRLSLVNGYNTRMENFTETSRGLYFADFCKQRITGPGLSPRTEPTKNFDMEDDDNFGEMTSALFLPYGNHVIVQYNHYGVRASTIAKYLSGYIPSGTEKIEFTPCLKGDLMYKLSAARSINLVETKFDFSGGINLPEEMSNNESALSVWNTMKSFDENNAARIEVKISKQRGNFSGMKVEKISKYLKDILSLHDEGHLKSAKVKLEEDGEEAGELLDLLRAKEEIEVTVEWASDQRMMPTEVIHKALSQSYIHWRNQNKLDEQNP